MVVFTLHADGHLVSGEPSVSNDSVESKRERETLSLLGSDFKTQNTARCRVRFMSCYFSRRLLTILILSLLSSLFCPWFAQLALVLMTQSIKSLNREFDWSEGGCYLR